MICANRNSAVFVKVLNNFALNAILTIYTGLDEQFSR